MEMRSSELSAKELFDKYDDDGSGTISIDEFKPLLIELSGINLTLPKIVQYFRLCDTDGSGLIDFDEFKVALFASNSESLNPDGFNPGTILRPQDAFAMFDEDGNGLDETEFSLLLEFLGIDTDEKTMEQMFCKYDTDKSGIIDYKEFKKIWLVLANPRKELEDRKVNVPALLSRAQLIRLLEEVLDEEERKEALSIKNAKKYQRCQVIVRERQTHTSKALHRSHIELCRALDAAGQVYVFGDGSMGQISAAKVGNSVDPLLAKLFCRRVNKLREDDLSLGYKVDKDLNSFQHHNVHINTLALWGKQIIGVSTSDSTIIAHSKSGVVTWGGHGQWWYPFQGCRGWQEVDNNPKTARSNIMRGLQEKDDSILHNFSKDNTTPGSNSYGERFERTKQILQYYRVWSLINSEDFDTPLEYSKSCLQNSIQRELIIASLTLRGQKIEDGTKNGLVDKLFECLSLERRILGETKSLILRDLEREILSLRSIKKLKLAKRREEYFRASWMPITQFQKSLVSTDVPVAPENNVHNLDSSANIERNTIENVEVPDYLINEMIPVETKRHRADPIKKGWKMVTAGANHAGMLSNSGDLYMWGLTSSGRLGLLEGTQKSSKIPLTKTESVLMPVSVPISKATPISTVSCGHSHTAAVLDDGQIYVWGSTSSGKLGFGEVTLGKELYCSHPTAIALPTPISQVSCGSNHTACVGCNGHLYVWGNGNGYRLGLGDTRDRWNPTLVPDMTDICNVSCGNCQTLAVTKICKYNTSINNALVVKTAGGKLFVAGQASVLGSTFKYFGEYEHFLSNEKKLIAPKMIKHISAGFSHQAVISSDGELFSWGDNVKGCSCHDVNTHFIPIPSQVTCLYTKPKDLAFDISFYSSTPYAYQPFREIKLNEVSTIEEVKLWNILDDPNNPAVRKDTFTSRLFPCWILISQTPFPLDAGAGQLGSAMKHCTAKHRFEDNYQMSSWCPPTGTMGQYIRVQLEEMNLLEYEKLEVFGAVGVDKSLGKVVSVDCGKRSTTVIVKACDDGDNMRILLERAAAADPKHETILRRFEAYRDVRCIQKSEKYDRVGCILCAGDLCEICRLKQTFTEELKGKQYSSLDQLVDILLDDKNIDAGDHC